MCLLVVEQHGALFLLRHLEVSRDFPVLSNTAGSWNDTLKSKMLKMHVR